MPDVIHRGLIGSSVHLADWPFGSSLAERDLPPRDHALEQEMSLVRLLAEAGRRIRVEAVRRQRLPCRSGWVVGGPDLSQFHDILADELNVETLTTENDLDSFQKVVLAPNRKTLGAKCRADLPAVLAQLDLADPESLLLEIEAGIAALAGYEITLDDIEVRRVEKDGFAAYTLSHDAGDVSLVLDMDIDAELLSKGLARDIIRRVQAKRKQLDLEVEATIELSVWVDGMELADDDWEHVKSETRAGRASLNEGKSPADTETFEVDRTNVMFYLS
jgi:isoleucyl-tRNA synthetase